jgi:hypothetical protein
MFSVRYDDRKGLLTSVRAGFFDLPEARRFGDAFRQALAQGERARVAFDILVDNSAGDPLSSDVAKYFEEIALDIRASRARRIAFISPGAVNRIQARRITRAGTDDRLCVFEDATSAEAWLAEI